MTAKCKATSLTADQRSKVGGSTHISSVYELSQGHEYTILGIMFAVQSSIFGSTALFEVRDDAGRCYSVPTCLFEIVDPRPSRWWIAKQLGDFNFVLWPHEFYQEFFHDDLSNGLPERVAEFESLVQRLKDEF